MSKSSVDSQGSAERKGRMKSGVFYLAISAAVLLGFLWLIPEVFGFDLAEFMRGASMVAILRIALGVFFLFILAASIRYVIASFTLEGETWRQGLANAMRAHVLGRDGVAVALLAFGGIALIVWGVVDLIG